jgi:hypothetical protein
LLGKHLNLLPKICFQTDGGSFGAFDVSQLVFHFVKQVFGLWFLSTVFVTYSQLVASEKMPLLSFNS